MPTYLNTARHPLDLGTGAMVAPQQQVKLNANPTIEEHLEAGRLVELQAKTRSTTTSTKAQEES